MLKNVYLLSSFLLWALSWEQWLCWLLVRGGPSRWGSDREKIQVI